MTDRRLVIHGHFYQPPRENPWTETVPVEPSASPAHDWNERVTDESYRPNAFARILDDHGALVALVDNYRLMSFNVGPTLMSWLDDHRPDVYGAIVRAGRDGRRRDRAGIQPPDPAARCSGATSRPRCAGASPTSRSGSVGRQRGCGCPRPA